MAWEVHQINTLLWFRQLVKISQLQDKYMLFCFFLRQGVKEQYQISTEYACTRQIRKFIYYSKANKITLYLDQCAVYVLTQFLNEIIKNNNPCTKKCMRSVWVYKLVHFQPLTKTDGWSGTSTTQHVHYSGIQKWIPLSYTPCALVWL